MRWSVEQQGDAACVFTGQPALEYGSVLGLIYDTFMFRMTGVTSLNLHSSQAF